MLVLHRKFEINFTSFQSVSSYFPIRLDEFLNVNKKLMT